MTYLPAASETTRKRIRLAEKAERAAERKERLNLWIESDRGQKVLIAAFVAVLVVTALIGGLVGN